MDDYSAIVSLDPNNPESIIAWESSVHNYGSSKIVVMESDLLHGNLGSEKPKVSKLIAIEVAGAKDPGPSPEQQVAIDFLNAHQAEVIAAARAAIYKDYADYYKDIIATWGPNEPEVAPKVINGDELDSIVGIGTVYVHHTIDGVANIGISFGVPWTDDDAGVLLQNSEVVDVGQAYTAMPGPPPN